MSHQKSGRKQKSRHRHGHGRGKKRDNHHVYPRSRNKIGDLDKFKPLLRSLRLRKIIKSHNAWHHLFINLFPEEVILLIKTAFQGGKKSQEDIISFIKQGVSPGRAVSETTKEDINAWRELFDSFWSWKKIKKTLKKEWFYPGVKTLLSKKKIIGVIIFLKNIPKGARIIDNIRRCKNIKVISLKNGELLKIV